MNTNTEKNRRKQYVWSQLSSFLSGFNVEIKKSSSPELEGLKGVIKEETSGLLKIQTDKGFLWVQKVGQIFEIELADKSKVIVDGNIIEGKPENRVKKRAKNW